MAHDDDGSSSFKSKMMMMMMMMLMTTCGQASLPPNPKPFKTLLGRVQREKKEEEGRSVAMIIVVCRHRKRMALPVEAQQPPSCSWCTSSVSPSCMSSCERRRESEGLRDPRIKADDEASHPCRQLIAAGAKEM